MFIDNKRDLTALVLCGGKGERLKPLTSIMQKCILPVLGEPFLKYVVKQIESFGIDKIVFCCGYEGQQIEDLFGNGSNYKYSNPLKLRGTGGSIKMALDLIDTENIIVFNGDSFCNINRTQFIDTYNIFIKSGYGFCKLSAHKNKSLLSSYIPNLIKDYYGAGIYFFKKAFIVNLPNTKKLSIEHDIEDENTMVIVLPEDVFVLDIGTLENYNKINRIETGYGKFFKDYMN